MLLVVISHFMLITLGKLWNRLYLYGSPYFSHIILGYRHLWALEAKWKFHWISINPLTMWDWALCQNSNCPPLSEPREPRSAMWRWEPFLTPNPTEVTHHPPQCVAKLQRVALDGGPGTWVRLGSDSLPGLFKELAHRAHTHFKISPCNCGLLALKAVSIQELMSYSASIFCTSCWCGQWHSGTMQKCCCASSAHP